ncbi:XrtB/PEP-CTERM-associated polysaccharide biosynthesis outer membrane protein EpsL [Herbaspirillum sp. YR522]|uniref:XrtB/PEP-CTERM-associated polysaccharide biosynthesis outer membrane protein EpsL n=1 Tax=Herbaspirillum sp. YR522 TaxID=1144342 RepID=UPI001EE6784B|nr:XrtB/PEP-CTERM-associated polysaccharide biosynthesis outer membrane protein EpsL [Herbaspirillum sp. YR522]
MSLTFFLLRRSNPAGKEHPLLQIYKKKGHRVERMTLQVNSSFSIRVASGIVALLTGSLACAQQNYTYATVPANDDVVTPYAQYSITYDDNVLRLRDAAQAQSVMGSDRMADSYSTTVGGLRINKLLGRQRFTIDASANRTKFDNFSAFDNDGKDLKANWSWVAGRFLSGGLGYVYSQALTPFQNFRVFERNIRTTRSKFASVGLKMHPDWTLRALFTQLSLGYSIPSQQVNMFTQNISELGLDYTPRSGSTVGLQARHTVGNYPYSTSINGVLVNNSFTQDELKAKVLWLYSGKTRLQFLGGMVDRKRQSGGSTNYSGFNARLIADWLATGKTSFSMNLWREIGGLNDVDANYALTNGVSLAATLASSDKLRFDGLVDYEKRNFNGAVLIQGLTPSGRRDKYERASFSVTYMPTSSLSLVAAIYRENLQSNIDSFAYVSNGVSLTTRYEF